MNMKNWMPKDQTRYIVILLVLLVATAVGLTNYLYNKVVYAPMKNYCESYLDTATTHSNELFMSLSLAKGALAVIDGSSVSVSFVAGMNVEVGDAVQPIYDAIDIAWDASLMSVISLQIQRLFFELFQLKLLKLLLLGALIFYLACVGLSLHYKKLAHYLWRLSRFLGILALCVYFVFPMGIVGTSAVAKYLDHNHKQPAYEELNIQLAQLNTFSKMDGQWSAFKEALTSLPSQLKTLSGPIFENATKIVTIYIIEVIILPVLFLLVFWNLTKVIIGGSNQSIKWKFTPSFRRKV